VTRALIASIDPPLVDDDHPSPILVAWKELLGDWVIPYDEQERRAKFARAYQELATYIAAWETLNQESR
jgi:hypothetical protein